MKTLFLLAMALVLTSGTVALAVENKADGIEGTWLPTAAELGGKAFPDEVRKSIKLEVKGDQYTVTIGPAVDKGTCKLTPSTNPRGLDVQGTDGPNKGKTILGIYERDGDTLRICYDLSGKARPAEFVSKPGSRLFLVTYKRETR